MLHTKAIRFVLVFCVTYGVLYFLNYAITGLMVPGGYYWAWLDNYVDYISGMRYFLLHTTSQLVTWAGHYNIIDGNILWVQNGHNIRLMNTCLGLNMLFLWWAFVVSFPRSFVQKIKWFVGGSILLIALNITRLTTLTIAPDDLFALIGKVDHHNLFNIISYGLIFLFIKISIDNSLKRAKVIAA